MGRSDGDGRRRRRAKELVEREPARRVHQLLLFSDVSGVYCYRKLLCSTSWHVIGNLGHTHCGISVTCVTSSKNFRAVSGGILLWWYSTRNHQKRLLSLGNPLPILSIVRWPVSEDQPFPRNTSALVPIAMSTARMNQAPSRQ